MMTDRMNSRGKNGRRSRAIAPLLLLLAGGTLACDNLLDVEAPGRVGFGTLGSPANAVLLVNSARISFECAFGNYVVVGGLMGNELEDSQLAAAYWDFDRRSLNAAGGQYATGDCLGGTVSGHGVYQTLHTAVFMGDTAVAILEGFSDAQVANRAELIATASAYAGYAVLLLGEAMCESPLRGSSAFSKNQLFQGAETRFSRALLGASATITNFANMGLARARLNRGDNVGALAAAQTIPVGFAYNATYATTGDRESNRVERTNVFGRQTSVQQEFKSLSVNANGTLGQGGATPDPRVVTVNSGVVAPDQTTIHWRQQKYTARNQPIPIARYAEAQLIIAEIQGGLAAVNIINALRAPRGIPAWTPINVNDANEILRMIIDERFRELFLESQHYYSLRRYQAIAAARGLTTDQLNPNARHMPLAGTAFKHGGIHGTQTCAPLPDAERLNNPNI